jgi:hypothetical protein
MATDSSARDTGQLSWISVAGRVGKRMKIERALAAA